MGERSMLARRPQSARAAAGVKRAELVESRARGEDSEPPAVASVNLNGGRGHQVLGGGPHLAAWEPWATMALEEANRPCAMPNTFH